MREKPHDAAPNPTPTPGLIHGTFVLTGVVNTILGPVLPWLAGRWLLSDAAAGALFSAEFAGGLCGGVASGWIVGRAGEGRTIASGLALMAIGVLTLTATSFAVAVAGMVAAGVGLGFVIPTMNLLVARLALQGSASALSALNLSWGVGALAWPLALALIRPVAGVAPALVVLALLLAAAAATVGRSLHGSSTLASKPRKDGRGRLNTALLFGALVILYTGVEAALGGWVAEYGRRLTLDAAQPWELSTAAFWCGLTIGRGAAAFRLADRHATRALYAGLGLTACSMAGLLATRDAATVSAAALAAGLGLAPVFPVTVAALIRDSAPRVASALIALASLGAATMPWLVGLVSDRTGSLQTGLALLLAAVIALGVLHAVRLLSLRR